MHRGSVCRLTLHIGQWCYENKYIWTARNGMQWHGTRIVLYSLLPIMENKLHYYTSTIITVHGSSPCSGRHHNYVRLYSV